MSAAAVIWWMVPSIPARVPKIRFQASVFFSEQALCLPEMSSLLFRWRAKVRREWLDHYGTAGHLVLWWIPVGHVPTVDEGADRLAHLDRHGPRRMRSRCANRCHLSQARAQILSLNVLKV